MAGFYFALRMITVIKDNFTLRFVRDYKFLVLISADSTSACTLLYLQAISARDVHDSRIISVGRSWG